MRPAAIASSIKRLTAPEHRIAEQAVEAFAPFASRERYAAYMCKLHAFYAVIEPPLFEALPIAAERRKLPRIEADLRALGVDAAVHRPCVPRIASRASAFGVGYVLEGKTLGSRFLLDRARKELGLDAESGAGFLAGYGAETGAMWRDYLDTLGGFVAAHGRRAAILRGARATFAAFTAWIV